MLGRFVPDEDCEINHSRCSSSANLLANKWYTIVKKKKKKKKKKKRFYKLRPDHLCQLVLHEQIHIICSWVRT